MAAGAIVVSRHTAAAIHVAAWPGAAIGGVGRFRYNASISPEVWPAFRLFLHHAVPVLRSFPRRRSRNSSETCA
jgi:hypothetical protein